MTVSLEIVVIAVLVLLNGFLAMSEMAVVSSKKARLKKLVDEGNTGAGSALKLADSSGDFLASIQVGITLIGVLAGAFSGATISEKLSAAVLKLHPSLAAYADAIGLGLVVIAVTYLSLVFGELVPKRLALNSPEVIASRVSQIVRVLGVFLKPMVYLLNFSTHFVLRLLGADKPSNETVTQEEVKILIEEGAEAGVFDRQEETMIKQVLRLDDRDVRSLMTPRTKVIGIDIRDPIERTLEKVTQYSHSYFPVFDRTMDQPIGLLSVKAVLKRLIQKEAIELRELLTTALFLPESMAADDALQKFRTSGKHIAFVVDEYGGFAGVLTVYDITESIVGAIPNNNQLSDPKIVVRDNGSFLVEGHMAFQEFVEFLKLNVDSDQDFQTVGGFMMTKLERIPKEGDSVEIEGYRIEVVDMDRHRVDKVLVEKIFGGLT